MEQATTSGWKSTQKNDISLRNLDSKPKVPRIFVGVGSRFLVGNFPGIDQNMHETNEGREKREHGVSTCRFLDVYEYISTSRFRKLSFELRVWETIMLYPILHHLTCCPDESQLSTSNPCAPSPQRFVILKTLQTPRMLKQNSEMPGNGWNGFKKHTCSQNHLIFIWKKTCAVLLCNFCILPYLCIGILIS